MARAVCSSKVLLPIPGSPPRSSRLPGTIPPPNTRSNSPQCRYCETAQYYARKAIEVHIKAANSEEFVKQKITFKRKIDIAKFAEYKNFVPYTLGEDEYWVMGDNYSASSDCFNKKSPIYRDNIVGVLIAIEGTCKIDAKLDPSSTIDGTKISYQCKDSKRHFPTYY